MKLFPFSLEKLMTPNKNSNKFHVLYKNVEKQFNKKRNREKHNNNNELRRKLSKINTNEWKSISLR